MTHDEAEAAIVNKVKEIDAIRAGSSQFKDELIAQVDAEIAELKKITGPRHITGTH